VLTAVLDTSVLAGASLKPGGANHEILRRAGQDYRLVLSEAIRQETEHILLTYRPIPIRYPHADQDVRAFLRALRKVSHRVLTAWAEVRVVEDDPDDDMVLGCTLAGEANLIVSKDHHLQTLGSFKRIMIVSTQEFLEMLPPGASGSPPADTHPIGLIGVGPTEPPWDAWRLLPLRPASRPNLVQWGCPVGPAAESLSGTTFLYALLDNFRTPLEVG